MVVRYGEVEFAIDKLDNLPPAYLMGRYGSYGEIENAIDNLDNESTAAGRASWAQQTGGRYDGSDADDVR